MATDHATELSERFQLPSTSSGLAILAELQSILRIHNTDPEDLSFKWESYCMKMGAEETKLDVKTVKDFRKDLQEQLEDKMRAKPNGNVPERRAFAATPRAGMNSSDMFDLLVPNTPGSAAGRGNAPKRRGAFDTPGAKSNKPRPMSSPMSQRTPAADSTPSLKFSERKDSGAVVESLNSQIKLPESSEDAPPEPRFKLKANSEIAKFNYKIMAMKLSESSDILNDRIEEFVTIIQEHHNLEDGAFGNPASQSQNEIIAVGRIASEASEGKLNPKSIVLETSRRMGAGRRVPLNLDKLRDFDFFPGKIVALKGTNASGEFFQPTEVLDIPTLNPVASNIEQIDEINDRLAGPDGNSRSLVTIVASGPYTTDENLDFAAFDTLLKAAESVQADSLVLLGPFIDAEHPLIKTGDFDLPEGYPVEPDRATLNDVFKAFISHPLTKLTKSLPSISIVLCPSVRDAISKHAAWPQDRLVKRDFALPRQVSVVPNPMKLSMNEVQFGMSSQDVLDQIRSSEVYSGKYKQMNALERLCRGVLDQRHFFPVFPAILPTRKEYGSSAAGPSLDISYLKLGGMLGVLPDVMVTPSILPQFAKVIDGVLIINPGSVSKRKGPGSYARMIMEPLEISDEERDKGEIITHKLYERCRVDIVKI